MGPKGGLPSLKKDLIRLAAFLEQPVDEKATVEQLKSVLRPLVSRLFLEAPKKTGSSSSSQAVVAAPKPKMTSSASPPRLPVQGLTRPVASTLMGQGLGREPYQVALDHQSVVSTEMEETPEEIERVVDP